MDPFLQLAAQGAMIERLSSDSRRCAPGVAFLAYPGEKADGRAHIGDAILRGASAVLWEGEGFSWDAGWRLPNVAVEELKQQAGRLAHEFYGKPSEALWVCGVTGTNGKTSCSQWIAAALARHGSKAGVIGTLGSGFPGALAPLVNTTPDALELHLTLKQMRADGAKACAFVEQYLRGLLAAVGLVVAAHPLDGRSVEQAVALLAQVDDDDAGAGLLFAHGGEDGLEPRG